MPRRKIVSPRSLNSIRRLPRRNSKGSRSTEGVPDMALTRGDFGEYDFNRMVVLFTMKNDEANVACAISTDAMDQLEGSSRTPPAQREQQFLRLRDRIEER